MPERYEPRVRPAASHLAALFIGLLSVTADAQGQAWARIDDPAFSMRFPGSPERKENAFQTDHGPTAGVSYRFKTAEQFTGFSYVDYPRGALVRNPPANVLRAEAERLKDILGASLRVDRVWFLDGGSPVRRWPGRELAGVTKQGEQMSARLFMVGPRVYRLFHLRVTEAGRDDLIEQLVSSFELKQWEEVPLSPPLPTQAALQPVARAWSDVDQPEFSARLPGSIARKEKSSSSSTGTTRTVTYAAESDDAYSALLVQDFENLDATPRTPADRLLGAQQGAVAVMGGKLVTDRAISLRAGRSARRWPGREFEVALDEGLRMRIRIYLVGSRLYQLQYGAAPGPRFEETFARIVESFRLKRPQR
jgi:hypothetical protein